MQLCEPKVLHYGMQMPSRPVSAGTQASRGIRSDVLDQVLHGALTVMRQGARLRPASAASSDVYKMSDPEKIKWVKYVKCFNSALYTAILALSMQHSWMHHIFHKTTTVAASSPAS